MTIWINQIIRGKQVWILKWKSCVFPHWSQRQALRRVKWFWITPLILIFINNSRADWIRAIQYKVINSGRADRIRTVQLLNTHAHIQLYTTQPRLIGRFGSARNLPNSHVSNEQVFRTEKRLALTALSCRIYPEELI